ncbi:hypothetical protein, partial [Salmonella enterica]|uniref:hypothetical protein n=1 Tax=Salmonella enterica TaxID=28901 RepID=UPI003D2D688F
RLNLREELAVLGEHADVGVHPEALLDWAQAVNPLNARWIAPCALGLPLLAVAAAVLWAVTGLAALLFLVLLVEGGILAVLRRPVDAILHGSETA